MGDSDETALAVRTRAPLLDSWMPLCFQIGSQAEDQAWGQGETKQEAVVSVLWRDREEGRDWSVHVGGVQSAGQCSIESSSSVSLAPAGGQSRWDWSIPEQWQCPHLRSSDTTVHQSGRGISLFLTSGQHVLCNIILQDFMTWHQHASQGWLLQSTIMMSISMFEGRGLELLQVRPFQLLCHFIALCVCMTIDNDIVQDLVRVMSPILSVLQHTSAQIDKDTITWSASFSTPVWH